MKIPFLDLSRKQRRQYADLDQIFRTCILEDFLSGGRAIASFEQAFATYIGTTSCIGCGNGTDALEIILRALDIGKGDEVIVPANGWLSAAEMVKLVKATPIFVDVDPHSHNLSPELIEEALSPRTKAIIPIHLYGQPADMPAIMEIAEQHQFWVIEDCAQAHGASIAGRKVGSWGHAAAYSFYPTKNLGALGDAGAILTSDQQLAERCRMIANHGQVKRDEHQILGRNSRMDTLQAAVLEYRLGLLNEENQQRRSLAELYRQQLQNLPLKLSYARADAFHVYHLFVVSTSERDALRQYLEAAGIGTAIHYPHAVSEMPHLNPKTCPVASQQSKELLSLPLYPELREEEVVLVCEKIRQFFS